MLQKKKWLIITFSTTADALGMERFCQEEHLPGKLSQIPAAIEAGCGLAWKAEPEAEELLMDRIEAAGIRWDALYEIEF